MKTENEERLKLSVIVPAYNVDGYIAECVESVLSQSYKNIELIIVNDGSTDQTREIIRRFESDARVIVVSQPNGGLSAARNTGIEMASGDLLTFVDADDRIHEITFAANIRFFNSNPDIDFVQYPVTMEWQSGKERVLRPTEARLSNHENIFAAWWKNDQIIYSVANKIFKRHLFNDIRFPVRKYYEDIFVMVPLCQKINRVIISEFGMYYYRYRKESIINSKSDIYAKSINQLEATLLLYRYAQNFRILKNERAAFFLRLCQWQFYTICSYSAAEQARLLKMMQHQTALWSDIFCAPLTPRQKLTLLSIRIFGFNATNLIYLIVSAIRPVNQMKYI